MLKNGLVQTPDTDWEGFLHQTPALTTLQTEPGRGRVMVGSMIDRRLKLSKALLCLGVEHSN